MTYLTIDRIWAGRNEVPHRNMQSSLTCLQLILAALLLCFLSLSVRTLRAQAYSASITGVVADSSGAVIPDARVVAKDVANGFTYSATANNAGIYTVTNLPPSTYDLTITANGFEVEARTGIALVVSQHATINVRMNVGSTSQTVLVTGAPPLLEAQDATTGQTVERATINDLPLIGRSVFDLSYLSPGVNPPAGQVVGFGPPQANDFNSDGGRNTTTDIVLDGTSVTAPDNITTQLKPLYTPSVEAVQEFKVEQNGFSADKGFSGNTVVNVVMRSGSNDYHGDVYDFIRNKSLDANDWFDNRAGVPLPGLHDNDFGATFGGPIRKNKMFFFVDYEGDRSATAATFTAGVPSAAERTGDFSELCADNGGAFDAQGKCSSAKGQLWDPYTATYNSSTGKVSHTAFIPNNKMATYTSPGSSALAGTPYQATAGAGNLIDPVAARMMSYYPMPNLNVGAPAYNWLDNWTGAGANTSDFDKGDVKIDRQFSDKTHFDARYSMEQDTAVPANPWNNSPLFPTNGPETVGIISTDAHVTHTFSPTFVLTASYGYGRSLDDRTPSLGSFNAASTLGLPGYLGSSGVNIPPAVTVATYTSVAPQSLGSHNSAIIHFHLQVHNALVNFEKMHGRHDLQFGGEMRVTRDNFTQPVQPGGAFNFSFTGTSGASTAATGGDAMASFLTGFGTTGNYQFAAVVNTQAFNYAAYIQDNFHATNKLTLNLGLRYELALPRTERSNQQSLIDPSAVSPLSGQVSLSSQADTDFSQAGLPVPNLSSLSGGMEFTSGNSRYPVNPNYKGFAPRFGFAYRLPHTTVVRGGYGIFYDVTDYTTSGTAATGFTGFTQNTSWLTTYQGNGYTPWGRLSNPFPNGLLQPPGSSEGLSTDLGLSISGMIRSWNQLPYEQTWNLGLQHQFGSVLVDAEYVGTKGTHLYFGGAQALDHLGSWIESASPAQITALNTFVPNPFYGVITTVGCTICGPTVQASQLALPYPQFAGVAGPNPPSANSAYNALQLKVERSFSRGFEVLGNFTWSKTMDDASISDESNLSEGGVATTVQDPNNLGLERSLSEYDMPLVMSFSGIYQLPFGRGEHWGSDWGGITSAFLGGWQTQGFWRFDDGQPLELTLESGLSDPLPTYGAQRPSLTGMLKKNNGSENSMVAQYFANPQVAAVPAPFTLGTAPRALGSVRALGTQNADLSLFKSFPIQKLGESGKLQFRIETFNALNHVEFAAPNTQVGSSSFGLVTAQANSPRQVQGAAKIYW